MADRERSPVRVRAKQIGHERIEVVKRYAGTQCRRNVIEEGQVVAVATRGDHWADQRFCGTT
jgi:hypothetical protein